MSSVKTGSSTRDNAAKFLRSKEKLTRHAKKSWISLLREIPKYDSFRDAEENDLHFDVDTAQKAIDFIEECCTHVKGEFAGDAFILQKCNKAIVANTFGWIRPDGTRRSRQVLL